MKILFFDNQSTDATLTAYICDTVEDIEFTFNRPAVLVIPGGGYRWCSKREAEPIALKFLAAGYNVFVLNYTLPAVFPMPLREAEWAMEIIRKNAKEFFIDKNKIAVCGFSAGAHLAGMLSTMSENKFTPKVCVLSYPVIDGVEYAHKGSFDWLLGEDADENKRREFSLQNKVTSITPPTFIWHTANDDTVPVQNSLLYAKALADNNIPFELKIYDSGIHGLSTCEVQTANYDGHINPHCAGWFNDALKFLKKYL